jgi:predicted kinase
MNRSAPLLIIVTGPPGAGKTTLARQIAEELKLPLVAKDDIKELLFNSLGWTDREASKKLGTAAFQLLAFFVESQLAVGRSLVTEANFYPEFMTIRFRELQKKHPYQPIQIYCRAESSLLEQRFRSRWNSGLRHPGHADNEISTQDLITTIHQNDKALDIGGQIIEIDTTDFDKIAYAALFQTIENARHSCEQQAT